MKSRINLNFGFELEVVPWLPQKVMKNFPSPVKLNYSPNKIGNSYWGLTTDSSIGIGTEIRSSINPRLINIKQVINYLKYLKCKPNSRSGLHIHISSDRTIIFNPQAIKKVIIWKRRSKFCMTRGKFVPIRRINKRHIEVRLFNSSLNFRYIIRSINFTLNNTVPFGEWLTENVDMDISNVREMDDYINKRFIKLLKIK